MNEIDDPRIGSAAVENTLDDANVGIRRPKVRQERDKV